MAMGQQARSMDNRGLLTADDRAFFEGEKSTENPEQTRRDKRYNVRRRVEKIAEDIEILRDAGETDLVEELYDEIGRYERLESKLEELEAELDDGN